MAVQRFQRANGLEPDGVVGRRTWKALDGCEDEDEQPGDDQCGASVPLPNTYGMSEEEKYDYYIRCIRRTFPRESTHSLYDLLSGRRVIVGLRKLTNTRANNGLGLYDDRIVVLWKKNGEKHVREFVANTEPSSRYEHRWGVKAYGSDADGDGRKDLGRIPEGAYTFMKDFSDHYGNILRPTHEIIAERDTNHDGVFDGRDRVTNRAALSAGTSFLFHKGGTNMTGSAGCQTMRSPVFQSFWHALGNQHTFRYVLIHTQHCPPVHCVYAS